MSMRISKKTLLEAVKKEAANLDERFQLPGSATHASPYKFDEFKLGINEKRGKSLGWGVYMSRGKVASGHFTMVGMQEGVNKFSEAVNNEMKSQTGQYLNWESPEGMILQVFIKKIPEAYKSQTPTITGDLKKDIESAAQQVMAGKSQISRQNIDNAYNIALKHINEIPSVYLYEIEYEGGGYFVPSSDTKITQLPKWVIDKMENKNPALAKLIENAKSQNMGFTQFYFSLFGPGRPFQSPKEVSGFLDSIGVKGQENGDEILVYNEKNVRVVNRRELSYHNLGAQKSQPIQKEGLSRIFQEAVVSATGNLDDFSFSSEELEQNELDRYFYETLKRYGEENQGRYIGNNGYEYCLPYKAKKDLDELGIYYDVAIATNPEHPDHNKRILVVVWWFADKRYRPR